MQIERNTEVDRIGAAENVSRMQAGAAPPAAAQPPVRTVQLSDSARSVQMAQQALTQSPPVRSERVQQLKAQVDQGTYTVDPSALAATLSRVLQ